jgi:hypothetical protein
MADSGLPSIQRSFTSREQSEALQAEVARWARDGWTVSHVGAVQAVLQRKKRIGWFWNLLLAIITGGLWLIVVIVRVVNRKIQTKILTVDTFGTVTAK